MPPRFSRACAAAAELVSSLTWLRLLFDVAFVVGWTLLATVAFARTGWPTWLYYLVLFSGVVGYSLASGR